MLLQVDHPTEEIASAALKESKRLEHKNKLQEALDAIERVSSDAINLSVPSSLDITEQIASICNKLVSASESPVSYLRRAEQVLSNWMGLCKKENVSMNESTFRLVLLTFNNWGTYHQAMKNYHMALNYLMRGLKIIEEFHANQPDSLQFIAKTKLNISALYSELRRYKEAISHAEQALATLQLENKQRLDGRPVSMLSTKEKYKVETMITTYVIAFYNIGVAEESLGHRKAMIQAYTNAVNIGSQFLSDENHVLETAKKALAESQIIRPDSQRTKGLRPLSSREFMTVLEERKKSLEEPFEFKTSVQPDSQLNTEQDKLNTHISLPSLNLSAVQKEQKPERYYSPEELKRLQKRLTEDPTNRFVSADQYFYTKISKTLNIGSDVKHMRPLSTSGAMNLWEKEKDDKRKISDLRLRKHFRHMIPPQGNTDVIVHRIARLKAADEENIKRQEIKMKSKMKTKVYKNLLKMLNSNNTNAVPPQRLFFKPPVITSNQASKDNSVRIEETSIQPKKGTNFKVANDEIESIMDRIHDEIKAIDIEKGISKEKIIEKFEESAFDSRLAQSALRKKLENGYLQDILFVKSSSSPIILSSERIVNSVKNSINRFNKQSRPQTAAFRKQQKLENADV